jgi:hypothetical protein
MNLYKVIYFALLVGLTLSVKPLHAAEKLIADYGGHAGFQT